MAKIAWRMASFVIVLMLILTINACQSVSYEQRLIESFHEAENNLNSNTGVETIVWLASGYHVGYVYTVDGNGFRYFSSIQSDPDKAFLYYKMASEMGDTESLAYLGIFYREGIGVEKDLMKARDLLKSTMHLYWQAAGEYGVALHESLKEGIVNPEDVQTVTEEMITALEIGAEQDYLPALNSLNQIYMEGEFVEESQVLAVEYREEATRIASKQVSVAAAMADAQRRLIGYQTAFTQSVRNTNRMMFLLSIGSLAAFSLISTQPCTFNCSPPSVNDLLTWGAIKYE